VLIEPVEPSTERAFTAATQVVASLPLTLQDAQQ
jgi:hypothetical protein